MGEVWKDIKHYEGLYKVSNLGNIKSLKRNTTTGKILKPSFDKDGYLKISLCKNGKCKNYRIHRLVALTFIENPFKYNIINHKDENKQNNCVDNLEWCTTKYNTNYNGANYKRGLAQRKKIIAEKDGKYQIFNGVIEAANQLGLNHSLISLCLTRKRKTTGNYKFNYY